MLKPGYVEKFGIAIPPLVDSNGKAVAEQPEWLIVRNILKNYDQLNAKFPGKLKPRYEHMLDFITLLWGDESRKFYFQINPNCVKIIQRYHEHRYLAVAGHASSGKSETMAVLSVAEFLVDPDNVKCLVTSTDSKSAKGKIFGSIENCWNTAVEFYEMWEARFRAIGISGSCFIPGRLISSESVIRGWDGKVVNSKRGIELIAAELSKAAEASSKMQGAKAPKLLLFADELATITPAVLETATSNLRMNEGFRCIGSFNPKSYYDSGGIMSKPAAGWDSITEDSDEWSTCIEPQGIIGHCIKFDGVRSPNVIAGRTLYKGLITLEMVNDFRATLGGDKTKAFMSQVRGFWSSGGDKESIYSESDIIQYHGDRSVTTWLEQPVTICGIDPSFAHGGDRAVLTIAKVGKARNIDTGTDIVTFEKIKSINLDNDITNKSISKDEWVVKLLRENMLKYGVKVTDLAIDTTGSGASFSSLVRRDIGTGFLDVVFNASPSDMKYSSADKRTGKERFANLMSEIWMVGKELIRSGQLKGLDPDVIDEMCSRTYVDTADKATVEPKAKMKLRTRKSPDCFVAGTMITTPSGDVAIEEIKVGDFVETPLGPRQVIYLTEQFDNKIFTAEFEGGTSISGKGSHRIFTWDSGWVPIKDLCLTNKTESVKMLESWKFLQSLFTTEENTQFKLLVDTIRATQGRKIKLTDFFTELSGLKTMGLFLMVLKCITKMDAGTITTSQILSLSRHPSIDHFTPRKTWSVQSGLKELWLGLKKLGKLQKSGTPQKKEELGTVNMERIHGKTESATSTANATSAEKNLCHTRIPSTAPLNAIKRPLIGKEKKKTQISTWLTRLAVTVEVISRLINTSQRGFVLKGVRRTTDGTQKKLYDLTLDGVNAYYANGILVENCADSLFITLHLARLRHNLSSTERAAPRHTPTTPALPPQQRQLQAELAALPQWQPQKRRATLSDLAASVGNWAGAGWGDSY